MSNENDVVFGDVIEEYIKRHGTEEEKNKLNREKKEKKKEEEKKRKKEEKVKWYRFWEWYPLKDPEPSIPLGPLPDDTIDFGRIVDPIWKGFEKVWFNANKYLVTRVYEISRDKYIELKLRYKIILLMTLIILFYIFIWRHISMLQRFQEHPEMMLLL